MRKRSLPACGLIVLLGALLVDVRAPLVADAAQSLSIRPPFAGTRRQTSYFDHRFPNYANDGEITVYTGESVATCSPHCYRGHSGVDWSLETGTPLLAVADGIVRGRKVSSSGYGWRVVIEHANGTYSLYAHLSGFNVSLNQPVKAGDVIGWSGNTGHSTGPHLHFGVYLGPCLLSDGSVYDHNGTDPFGWRGSGSDPMMSSPSPLLRHTATCLWRSHDADSISCADTIVEDAGLGASIFPSTGWQTGSYGNGYHTYYRSNTSAQYEYHHWSTEAMPGPLQPGPAEVYVFVPQDPDGSAGLARSQHVAYDVWTESGWQRVTVDQSAYTNEWVLLGTFDIADHGEVIAWVHTGEEAGTRWVMADAVKWRNVDEQPRYDVSLPLVLQGYCFPRSGELFENGHFASGDGAGWVISRTVGTEPVIQPYGPTEHGAWMGRYDLNRDTMAQAVCLPNTASPMNLSFWWWVSSIETVSEDVDFLRVVLRDAAGDLLSPEPLVILTNRSPQGQWFTAEVDLSAYAGQLVWVSFEASNDGDEPTSFWIDSTSLDSNCSVCGEKW